MPTAAAQVNSVPVIRPCKIGCHMLEQVMASAGHFTTGACVLQQCDKRHAGNYAQSPLPHAFWLPLSTASNIDSLVYS